MKKKPLVECRHCSGKGIIPISDELFDTLQAIRLGCQTASQVHLNINPGCGITAINNRLEDLRGLGLIERTRKVGKTWHYTIA